MYFTRMTIRMWWALAWVQGKLTRRSSATTIWGLMASVSEVHEHLSRLEDDETVQALGRLMEALEEDMIAAAAPMDPEAMAFTEALLTRIQSSVSPQQHPVD